MELNSADLVWTHFAVANFLQHAKILDDNHTVLVLNRVFFTQVTQHPVYTLTSGTDHVGQICMRNFFVDEDVLTIAALLTISITKSNESGAKCAWFAIHHQITEFRLS
ncbi:hypothetical protein D3C71_1265740 [compost metagenome]